MRGNRPYNNRGNRGKRGGKNGRGNNYGHYNYKNNYNYNNKFDNHNNNHNQNNQNNNEEQYYNDYYNYNNQDGYYEEEGQNNNYNSSYNNRNNNYYHGFQRYNKEQFGDNTYKDKKKNKREYFQKLRKEQKLQEEQKKEEEKKEEEIKEEEEKVEDNKEEKEKQEEEEEEEDEETKEEMNKINEDIKNNIEQHKQNITEITKKEDNLNKAKKFETKFKKIICENSKIRNNPILIYNIMEIFKSKKSSDEMQGEFIDLLGFDEIATIEQFITNRDEIVESFEIAKMALDSNKEKIKSAQENLKLFGNEIMTEVMKSKKKKGELNELQKVQIENNKLLELLGFDYNFISRNNNLNNDLNKDNSEFIGGNQLIKEDNENKELHPVKIAFGEVGYNENIEKEKEIYDEVTKRESNYTMIKVKNINKKRNKIEPINVIKVLPKWAHKCFNFQFFNEIQSTVFDKSFNTDYNLLITAPTGAGKTNIALVTILREIEKELKLKNMNNIDDKFDFSKFKWDFKVLFLVPLKALANEFLNKFKEQLGYFNLVINEFSGDVDLTKEQIDKTNLFVGIPEKWDLFTRKHDDVFKSLKLVIIDEVHLLNEDRGRVLECIVARTILKMELLQKIIRLVGLSATLPNYYDVADFLHVKEGLFAFDNSYRATPLTMKFFGISDKRPYK